MDTQWNLISHRVKQFVFDRKQKLSRQFQPNPERKQVLRNWSLLLVSLILGLIAYESTKEATLRNWIKKNPPSSSLSEALLNTKNFKRVTDLKANHRIIKSLPLQWDEPSSLWMSKNSKWIVIFPLKKDDSPLVYSHLNELQKLPTLKTKHYPKKWIPMGQSWPGMQTLLEKLSRLKFQSARSQTVRKAPQVDPREINY